MFKKINFKSVKKILDPYTKELSSYKVVIDDTPCFVPICVGNTEYDEIKRQVDAGELTIEDAD
jgi:hypothetical protein